MEQSAAPQPVVPAPEPPHRNAKASQHREGLRSILSTLGVIVAAILFAMVLTSFVFQSYQVDGPSMETTLQNRDRLIIWKTARTVARITNNDYIPNRGDVVVFVENTYMSPDGKSRQLIKRVIGLPGDHVVIKNGQLTVYNKEHPDGFNPDKTLPYGQDTDLSIDPSEEADVQLEKGEIFVMGDNRSNSLDSRAFGPIQAHNIVGKLALRVFPLDNAKAF